MRAEGIWGVDEKLEASEEAEVKRVVSMVWPEGDLGVSRSKCFITGVLPVNSWVRDMEATKEG